jgi:hypothetical protein
MSGVIRNETSNHGQVDLINSVVRLRLSTPIAFKVMSVELTVRKLVVV